MSDGVAVHGADRTPLSLTVDGETVVLHPERALELPAHGTLVVADLHWGKATWLRAQGVPVPPGGTSADLERLSRLLTLTGAKRLLVLGDLVHSRHGWEARAIAPVTAWRTRWPDVQITLVRGNHDAHAGDPPSGLGIAVLAAPNALGPFHCTHEPPATVPFSRGPRTLCGHLHPNVRLSGRGADRVRLPCFVLTHNALILPAFSTFTGGGAWEAQPGDRAFAIVDQQVLDAG